MRVEACPRRNATSTGLTPASRAHVAPLWRRFRNWKPGSPAALVAFLHARPNVFRRRGPPSGPGNRSRSAPPSPSSRSTCSARPKVTDSGMLTHRRDRFVFGSPAISFPDSTIFLSTRTLRRRKSRWPTVSPTSSDHRRDEYAPRRTRARYRESMEVASRSTSATVRTRGSSWSILDTASPAAGFRAIRSARTAEPRMLDNTFRTSKARHADEAPSTTSWQSARVMDPSSRAPSRGAMWRRQTSSYAIRVRSVGFPIVRAGPSSDRSRRRTSPRPAAGRSTHLD
jgi:hypothetical protein